MRTVNVRNLQRKISECVDIAQRERVVVTRHGRPAALLIGVEGQDWEDIFYQTSAAFWMMIEERRKGKTVPFEEMRRRLERRWARRDRKKR